MWPVLHRGLFASKYTALCITPKLPICFQCLTSTCGFFSLPCLTLFCFQPIVAFTGASCCLIESQVGHTLLPVHLLSIFVRAYLLAFNVKLFLFLLDIGVFLTVTLSWSIL